MLHVEPPQLPTQCWVCIVVALLYLAHGATYRVCIVVALHYLAQGATYRVCIVVALPQLQVGFAPLLSVRLKDGRPGESGATRLKLSSLSSQITNQARL